MVCRSVHGSDSVITNLENPQTGVRNDPLLIILYMPIYVHLDTDWTEKHKIEPVGQTLRASTGESVFSNILNTHQDVFWQPHDSLHHKSTLS